MPRPVKPTRSYESPRRREQAAATRRDILEAAQPLFEREGWPGTTMAGIAAGAGVAPKTVYLAFGSKSGVLRALWHLRLRGDRDDVPVAGQDWYRAVLDEPDPERRLRRNARNSRVVKQRVATLLETIRAAAPADPEIAELWDRIKSEYHDNQRAVARSLATDGALAPGISVGHAADVLWTLNNPSTWQLLVVERGWSPARCERWCADTACAQLLAGPQSRGSTATSRSSQA